MANAQYEEPSTRYPEQAKGPIFFLVLKDGKQLSGAGSVKIKNGISSLEMKSAEGKDVTYVPSQVESLSHAVKAGKEELVNFEDKYWLYRLNSNIDVFYQTMGESDLIFKKEKGVFRVAVKEDIIDLVKDNKAAYKFAKKGKVKKSLEAYINENIKPAADSPVDGQ